jgi:hypothetical protein
MMNRDTENTARGLAVDECGSYSKPTEQRRFPNYSADRSR